MEPRAPGAADAHLKAEPEGRPPGRTPGAADARHAPDPPPAVLRTPAGRLPSALPPRRRRTAPAA